MVRSRWPRGVSGPRSSLRYCPCQAGSYWLRLTGVMSLRQKFRSSRIIVGSCGNSRLAQGFDLGRGLHAAIGNDLLDHPQARLQPLDVGRILRGFLGRLAGNKLAHFFLVLEPALEGAHRNSPEHRNSDDDDEEYEKRRVHICLLESVDVQRVQAAAPSLDLAAKRGGRSASIWAAVSAPRSVTICSSTRTRCSSSVEREAYWAALSAALRASTSSFFSRNLKKRLNISISMTVGKPIMIVARSTAVGPSIIRSP